MAAQYQQKEPKKSDSSIHWSIYVAIIGLFGGGIACFQILKHMMMDWYWYPVFILGFGALGAALQFGWFKKKGWLYGKKGVGTIGFTAYNVLGVGSILTTLMFLLNMWIPVGAPVIEEYNALGYDQRYRVHSKMLTVLMLDEDAYGNDPDYRGVPFEAIDYFLAGYRTFGYSRRVGLFGFEVKDKKYLKYNADWCLEHTKSCEPAAIKLERDGEQIWLDQWIIH